MFTLNILKESPSSKDHGAGGKPIYQEPTVKGSRESKPQGAKIWEIRTEEQSYAFLNDKEMADENRYGQKIDLLDLTNNALPKDRPLYINDNPEVGTNPNRNKQHAFFFTADNCIGCHACEAACSEKNENPAHIAFRSVGYVEGGSYPDYRRMNISMACNHCDNPVCLKGCPTRAYTKHVEYGAVLQDPETCFGCGYCTWVCPYNAPQLDPIKGQVSKCNMCVDRLEVGLKPACVSACVGNALDFGVVENIPENRVEAKVSIPGFPTPEITHPNIRFQQAKVMPEEVRRTDSMPLKYHKDSQGEYKPVVDPKFGREKHWNTSRLSSRENPLVLFTLASQAATGAFSLAFLGAQLGLESLVAFQSSVMFMPFAILCFLLVGFGLFMSTMHLGKPHRFYRGFNNWRYSPVAREGLGVAAFMGFLSFNILLNAPSNDLVSGVFDALFGFQLASILPMDLVNQGAVICGYLAVVGGLVGLYYMNRCYRIPARPFWNHWQVGTSFFGNMLSLGAMVSGVVACITLSFLGGDVANVLFILGVAMLAGLVLEGIGLMGHSKSMLNAEHEGAASYYIQTTTFGKTYLLRNALLGLNALLVAALLFTGGADIFSLVLWGLSALLLVITSVIGRALFYVLVVPTTMPGAFFWKNKGFEEHARDIGLARMPQVGVIPDVH